MAFRRRSTPVVPSWASFLSQDQWAEFTRLIDAELRRRGLTRDSDGEAVFLRGPDGYVHRMSLGAVARKAAGWGRDDWAELIVEQFDVLHSTATSRPTISQLASPQDAVKAELRSTDELVTNPNLIHKTWWPGTLLALVFDHPDVVVSATPAELEEIGAPASTLQQLCLTNVWQQDQPERRPFTIGAAPAVMLTGGVFTSTFAIWPSRFLDVDPTRGVLIAVPNRHTVVLHAIGLDCRLEIIESVVGRMLPIWHGEPGPVSPSLF